MCTSQFLEHLNCLVKIVIALLFSSYNFVTTILMYFLFFYAIALSVLRHYVNTLLCGSAVIRAHGYDCSVPQIHNLSIGRDQLFSDLDLNIHHKFSQCHELGKNFVNYIAMLIMFFSYSAFE